MSGESRTEKRGAMLAPANHQRRRYRLHFIYFRYPEGAVRMVNYRRRTRPNERLHIKPFFRSFPPLPAHFLGFGSSNTTTYLTSAAPCLETPFNVRRQFPEAKENIIR